MRLLRRTLGKHKETESRSGGHDARASSDDRCHSQKLSGNGAFESRTFSYRLLRSGLVHWRKIIAGRTSIAARIYRSFCTNGNGFLRGVRIGVARPIASASDLPFKRQRQKRVFERFENVSTPFQARNLRRNTAFLARLPRAGKYAATQASRKLANRKRSLAS